MGKVFCKHIINQNNSKQEQKQASMVRGEQTTELSQLVSSSQYSSPLVSLFLFFLIVFLLYTQTINLFLLLLLCITGFLYLFFHSAGCRAIYNIEAVLIRYRKTFFSLYLSCFIFCASFPIGPALYLMQHIHFCLLQSLTLSFRVSFLSL